MDCLLKTLCCAALGGLTLVGCSAEAPVAARPVPAAVAPSASAPAPAAAAPAPEKTAPQEAAEFARPGFVAYRDSKDGRLWVFERDSNDHKAFVEKGPSARQVLRPAAGPGGVTLKSTESETIVAYLVARNGFFTKIDPKDGRLWVFHEGSPDHLAFVEKGPSARQVLRPSAGPLGMTLKSTEFDHINAYLAAN